MLIQIISWSLRNRAAVLLLTALVAVAGFISLQHLDIDAFPDTTPVQVQVNTDVPGLVATEVERLVTFPIELVMGGLPGLVEVRSISQFGLSQVTVTFDDGTDIYLVRQLIAQRLSNIEMPVGVPKPELGPIATGLGEVFHYVLLPDGSPESADMSTIRTVHDWDIRPEMRTVAGTAEINTWGGLKKQYQVLIDPDLLFKYDLTFQQVVSALESNNLNVGGGYIDRKGDMLLVHGIARVMNATQIGDIQIATYNGVPVCVRDISQIVIGHELRRGLVTADGKGEVLLGLGFMRIGENSHAVTQELSQRFEQLRQTLPPGIKSDVFYDRTDLVDSVIATVRNNLFDGALLVITILYCFLGNVRAGLVAAAGIPLCMLFAFIGMKQLGIAGTLLSLGAIDFGIVVDSSVVVIESIVRRLAHQKIPATGISRLNIIRDAVIEVRKPAVFGQLIIMIVYIPILTLQGVEGKMFRPMALTVILVLLGSLILSLTLTPVLASLALPKIISEDDVLLVRMLKAAYGPLLRMTLRMKAVVCLLATGVLAVAGMIAVSLGTEFIPQLAEGSIVIGIRYPPGTSYLESARNNTLIEQALLREFPDEIEHCWSRVGEPDINTDAGTPETTDTFVTLKPREVWKRAKTQVELVGVMEKALQDFRGRTVWFTQPIEMRLNEMLTGVRADLALKLFGNDLDELISSANSIADVLRKLPGCVDLAVDDVAGQPILQIQLDRDQIARYGLSAESVMDVVEAVSGKSVGQVIEGQLRFPLAIMLPDEYRQSPRGLATLMLATPSGNHIPLTRVADIREVRGAKYITRESSKRRITIQCNVRGRDIGGFVADAQGAVGQQVKLPNGYRLEWGGQFENMQRAQKRLMIVVPLALAMIIGLLWITFRNVADTVVVAASVPFACVGGIVALWTRDMSLSISAAVGFITLSGVSVLSSMVVVSAVRRLMENGESTENAVLTASVECLRTVVMTSLVASVGFLPMASSMGMGAEVQRPLATVVIGGVVTSMLMTLFILPVLCVVFQSGRRPEAAGTENIEAV
ncbi:efflux RND transporter permease subunit [Planctomicrobium piriforme]|uniref:Cobalt-zinc-cadmium resistance protein CzcA n=1 Tax=Planctomicrobium piriforme TaxID=1576369 RepID=A0A1I3QPJ4_9PLAN|nr:CusA/CzcA family heavy metal efflux RND transporter [Planctomicrobium piriforme]SFJ35998.1 cobalt-zinc-cadmium resistance protein CzcA [Planctomicrobium piriforme]